MRPRQERPRGTEGLGVNFWVAMSIKTLLASGAGEGWTVSAQAQVVFPSYWKPRPVSPLVAVSANCRCSASGSGRSRQDINPVFLPLVTGRAAKVAVVKPRCLPHPGVERRDICTRIGFGAEVQQQNLQ
jgi:hypothetical protein